MHTRENTSDSVRDWNVPAVYRLVVEGEVGAEWQAWFGATSLLADAGVTSMQLSVADQAELHGVLRRVHDMNLRLVELVRIEESHRVGARVGRRAR